MSTYKPGDWLIDIKGNQRPINTIFKVEDEYTRYRVADVKLWQPRSGDWCWFWDKLDLKPFLSKFIENTKDGSFVSEGITFTSGRVISIYCEPFIGELPTICKEY